jgi:hypothetical protein
MRRNPKTFKPVDGKFNASCYPGGDVAGSIPKVDYLMSIFTFGLPINSPKDSLADKDLSDIDAKR